MIVLVNKSGSLMIKTPLVFFIPSFSKISIVDKKSLEIRNSVYDKKL
jgi:hypothetical protein